MFKIVWSQEHYQEEYKRFCKSLGEPRHTSMIESMSWHTKMQEQFNEKLREEGIGWEKDVNDDYIKLRNTNAFKALQTNTDSIITRANFYKLLILAVDEAFGDLAYLNNGSPKLLKGAINRYESLLTRILADYGYSTSEY